MQVNTFKHNDPVAEIHVRIHPPQGWSEDNAIADAMWKDNERLTIEVKALVSRFESQSSAYVWQD